MTTTKKRVLSGVQPSGKLHLGNYFGAIKQHIALQDENQCFYFIADYHALTTLEEATRRRVGSNKISSGSVSASRSGLKTGSVSESRSGPKTGSVSESRTGDRAETLRENTLDVALDYLALGLDPDKTAFFRQSDVPEVTELAWIFSTVTNMGLLERAVSYKEKVEKGIDASVGLFFYPVLMAADILIYRSHVVPVGKDQVQHIEMTQDIAGKFNRTYGDIFPIPDSRLDKEAKVPGIDGQKMSKSYNNTIDIFAEGKPLEKTVMSIVTDSTPKGAPKDPERCNVFALYSLFATAEEKAALAANYRDGGIGYGDAKKLLFEKINTYFGPFRERRKQLAANPDQVEVILQRGAQRARAEARQTMALVRQAVGMKAASAG